MLSLALPLTQAEDRPCLALTDTTCCGGGLLIQRPHRCCMLLSGTSMSLPSAALHADKEGIGVDTLQQRCTLISGTSMSLPLPSPVLHADERHVDVIALLILARDNNVEVAAPLRDVDLRNGLDELAELGAEAGVVPGEYGVV
jgi:hypothetical protein